MISPSDAVCLGKFNRKRVRPVIVPLDSGYQIVNRGSSGIKSGCPCDKGHYEGGQKYRNHLFRMTHAGFSSLIGPKEPDAPGSTNQVPFACSEAGRAAGLVFLAKILLCGD